MKTIGVLGGIGPQATIDFEARLHRVAQGLIEPHTNEGYPPLVSVYMRYPPVLVGPEGTPSDPLTVDPRLLDAARRLGQWGGPARNALQHAALLRGGDRGCGRL